MRKLKKELEGELKEKEKLAKQVEEYRAEVEQNQMSSVYVEYQC